MDEDSSVTRCNPHDIFGGTWGVAENDSADMVQSKFNSTEDIANLYSGRVLNLFEQLVSIIEDYAPEAGDIDYDYIDAPPISFSEAQPPESPNIPDVDIGTPPSMRGEISPIIITNPELPIDNTITDSAPPLEYEELPYISNLLDNLKFYINDVIVNGGKGLKDEVFADILEIALTVDELEYEKSYRDAEAYYANKNHTAPPGALISRLNLLIRERTRNRQRITTELTNKQAELAYQQELTLSELGIKLEGLTIQQKNAIEDRAYSLAKDHITFFYMAVDSSLKSYQSYLEVYKTKWTGEEIKSKAIATSNKSITDTFIAEMDAYKLGITTELAIIEQITRVYVAEMSGYESLVKAESIKADVLIEKYKAQIQESNNKSKLSAIQAELVLKAAIAKWDASKDAMKSMTQISGQITASALSAFNASASISSGVTHSSGYSNSKSMSCSNSGAESIGISKNYNYSV